MEGFFIRLLLDNKLNPAVFPPVCPVGPVCDWIRATHTFWRKDFRVNAPLYKLLNNFFGPFLTQRQEFRLLFLFGG